MATRVIAAQDKTSSGAGDDVQIKAGNANTSGAGGNIILQPGTQATTGGDGTVLIKAGYTANALEVKDSNNNLRAGLIPSSVGYKLRLHTVSSTDSFYYSDIYTNSLDLYFQSNSGAYRFVGPLASLEVNCATNYPVIYTFSSKNLDFNISGGSTIQVGIDVAGGSPLVVKAKSAQTANIQEWHNSASTVLASIESSGRFKTVLNSASGLSTFNVAKTILGGVHFVNGAGSGTSARNEAAITFQGTNSTEAQAGIYVINDNSSGTHMAFATTDSYATGPQLALTITNTGVANFPRARPTFNGANLVSTSGGTTGYYPRFTDSATLGNSITFDNGTNVGIGTASPNGKLEVVPASSSGAEGIYINQGASHQSTIRFKSAHSVNSDYRIGASILVDSAFEIYSVNAAATRMLVTSTGNVGIGTTSPGAKLQVDTGATGTKGQIIKAFLGQSANLSEWQNSSGTVNSWINSSGNEFSTNGINLTSYTTSYIKFDTSGQGLYRTNSWMGVGGANFGSGFFIEASNYGRPNIRSAYPAGNGDKAIVFNTTTSLASSLSRIATFENNGTIGAYILRDGDGVFSGVRVGTGASGTGNAILGGNSNSVNTGNYNTLIGWEALYNKVAGANNVALGADAGYFQADGSTALTTTNNSIYIGTLCRGFSNSDSNSIVIGYQAIGQGANTTVIGNSNTVSTDVFGTLTTTLGAAAQKGLVVKGAATQSANLTEWQDSTGTVVAAVSPTGAFTGSSFTPYGTINSTTTIFGNNYWTPNYTGGVTSPSAGTYTKSTGNNAVWDGQVYSSEGYTKNVYCAARASQTNGYIMFGLNSDPAANASYSSLDYAWYFRGDSATLEIYESNALVANYGSYTTSTVLSITYDGENVRYWKDGVLQRTVARSTGNPLYFDSSFYSVSASLNSVQFGPIGQPFGISGTSGYLPKFTSQQTLGNSIVYDNGTVVGINTSSPTANASLTIKAATGIAGVVSFQRSSSTTHAFVGLGNSDSDSNLYLGNNNNSDTIFTTNSSEKMRLFSGGNLGITAGARIGSGTGYINAGATAAGYLELYNSTSGATTLMNTGAFNVLVGTNNTERIRVTSSGLVGIGTSTIAGNNPLADLHVNDASGYGSLQLSQSPYGATIDTGGEIQFAATYRSANDLTQVARIRGLRENATNNNWAGYLAFYTSTGSDNPSASTERMRINSSGNVGIGTASPSFKLQVDAASVDANIVANVTSGYGGIGVYAAGTNKVILGYVGANTNYGSQTVAGDIALKTNNSNLHITTGSGNPATTAYFSSAGNVGIGNVSPGARLQVDTGATGTKGQIIKAAASQTANLLEVQNSAGIVLTNIDANGHLTVSTTTSAYTYYSSSTTTRWATGHDSSNGYFRIIDYVWDGTTRLMITPGGNVVLGNSGGDQNNGPKLLVTTGPDSYGQTGASRKGIIVRGSASQTANLQEWQNSSSTTLAYMDANGNFAAVTKSFLIPHPTPAKAAEGKKLRYASLEGPENGVYFRGTLTGENEIILPDYWKDLVDPDSITVNLTARKRPQPNLFVVDANAEKVIVESDREICCDFIVYATRKDIAKLEVEIDGNGV